MRSRPPASSARSRMATSPRCPGCGSSARALKPTPLSATRTRWPPSRSASDDVHAACLRVLARVGQGLLADAEQDHAPLRRRLGPEVVAKPELGSVLALHLVHAHPERRGEPLVVERGRAKLEQQVPEPRYRELDHVLEVGEQPEVLRVLQPPAEDLEPHPGGRDRLDRVVVDVAGDPAALLLARLDEVPEQRAALCEVARELGVLAARADVADEGRAEPALVGFDGAQRDVDRELSPVLPSPGELEIRAHRARARIAEVGRAVGGVTLSEALRKQDLHRLAHDLVAVVAEQPFRLAVHEHDRSAVVDDHHAVRCRLEQSREALLALSPHLLRTALFGDVPHSRGEEPSLRRVDRAERQVHGELGPVLAAAGELDPDAGRPGRGIGEVLVTVLDVAPMEAIREEQLDGPAEELVALVSEQVDGLRVDEGDPPLVVDADDRIGRRVEQGTEHRLAATQRREPVATLGGPVHEVLDHGGHHVHRHARLAPGRAPNRLEHLLGRRPLGQIGGRAVAQHLEHGRAVLVRRQGDYPRVRRDTSDRRCGACPAAVGHPDVEHRHVGLGSLRLRGRLGRVADRRHELHPRLVGEEIAERFSERRLVLGDQDADRRGATALGVHGPPRRSGSHLDTGRCFYSARLWASSRALALPARI